MFEQVLLEGAGRANKGWTVLVSSGMQLGLVAVLSVVPLLNTDLLPKTTLQLMMVAPTPPPPPPPAAPPAERIPQSRPVAHRVFDGLHLSQPARIPEKVLVLNTEELPAIGSNGPGVPGGMENGVPGGINTLSPRLPEAPPVFTAAIKPAETLAPIPRLAVGGRVQEALMIHKVIPVYPPLARQTRTSGIVRFTAIIARDGTIQNLTLLSGHPMLVAAATEAVKQWRYRPTLLNGDPVEVIAPIEVIFTLN